MKKERVAIYNRCSTEEEKQKNALSVQVAESRELVAKKGWNLIDQFVELKSGTSTTKRKQYRRMMERLEEKQYDIVVIKSIDRLARNAKDWYLFLDCLQKSHTRLYLYLEQKFYVPEDALITGIKAILAEQFSKELSIKIKNAHSRRQEKRLGYNLTREMFGWNRIDNNTFEKNKKEADYYIQACAFVEAGYGYRKIANQMYELGARSKTGGRISETQWRKMLLSKRYCGTLELHCTESNFETGKREWIDQKEWIVIENALPAIISNDYSQKIAGILKKRARNV